MCVIPRRQNSADLPAVIRSELRDRGPNGPPDADPQGERFLDCRDIRGPLVPRAQRLERRDERPDRKRPRQPLTSKVLEELQGQTWLDKCHPGRERRCPGWPEERCPTFREAADPEQPGATGDDLGKPNRIRDGV